MKGTEPDQEMEQAMTSNNSNTVTVLVVAPDGTKTYEQVEDAENNLDRWQALVGGYIENLFVTYGVGCYVNEDGRRLGLAENPEATRLAGRLGLDMLRGHVVFFGEDCSREAEITELPAEWQGLAPAETEPETEPVNIDAMLAGGLDLSTATASQMAHWLTENGYEFFNPIVMRHAARVRHELSRRLK